MAETLTHRGPDSGGAWADESAGIALGHRRLAIIDLTEEGHQPMASASGRYIISFNGEIYNFLQLRKELGDLRYRGSSDTEVMLAGFERWGIQGALERFNGMFAFALWDAYARTLYLGCDRLGEKPVYYGYIGPHFLFASELKALRSSPYFRNQINRDALAHFLAFNNVPAPYSIFDGISKLSPGTLLSMTHASPIPRVVSYWSLAATIDVSTANMFDGSPDEAVSELDKLIRDAVAIRMIADVPLGAFLSGGVDSSTIVALMQAQSSRKIKTFSIGFTESEHNEADYARAVATHLGTDHTELYLRPDDLWAAILDMPRVYDEPFADCSQIPTYLVSKLARQSVTVALSGDAGDELFCGYTRYIVGDRLRRIRARVPTLARQLLTRGLRSVRPGTWTQLAGLQRYILPARMRQTLLGDKLTRAVDILSASSWESMYYDLLTSWRNTTTIVKNSTILPIGMGTAASCPAKLDFISWMMFQDATLYLPADILVKVDRAAMAVSLESRIPLLDPRIIEFAWRLPLAYKMRNWQSKWVLREVLHRYVPKHLVERPKMGFGMPLHSWLRGPLRKWADDLLSEKRLKREGFFNPLPIRRVWLEHLSGARNAGYALWNVLMFEAWLQHQR